MVKTKFLTLLSAGLLIINLLLIGFIFYRKPHGRHQGSENRNIIVHRLDFDGNQINSYDSLIQWHRTEVLKNENRMLQQKTKLYSVLKSDQKSSQKDSLINEISKIQVALENIHFKHFEDIKHLLTPEQSVKYDFLMSEIAGMFSNKQNKPGNHK